MRSSEHRQAEPRGRCRRAAAALALAVALAAPTSRAQQLTLGQPEAPVLGEDSIVVDLRQRLAAESRRLADRTDEPERVAAAVALRALAIALLDDAPDTPPQRLLWGLTLADHMDELDRLILDSNSPVEPIACAMLAHDLAIPAADLPTTVEEVDRLLRDALAELAQQAAGDKPLAGPLGWVPHTPVPAVSDWPGVSADLAAGSISPVARQRLAHLDSLLTDAQGWVVYRPPAARTQQLLADASRRIVHPPAWLDEASLSQLTGVLDRAIEGLTAPELRSGAMDDLTRLDELGVIVSLLDSLEARDGVGEARAGLSELIASAVAGTSDRQQLRVATRTLTLAHQRLALPAGSELVRPLRPAYSALLVHARQTESPVIAALPAILRDPSAISDPAVVSAISAHRRAIADLTGLVLLSELIAAPAADSREPVVADAHRLLARRVLELGQALDDEPQALDELRTLVDQAKRFVALPGEPSLRNGADAAIWNAVTSDRRDALIDAIDAGRAAWLDAWQHDDQPESLARAVATMDLLDSLMAGLDDAVAVHEAQAGPSAASAWPGWELPASALIELARGLDEQLGETTRLALAGQASRAQQRLDRTDPLLTLIARLQRGARARGLGRARPRWLELAAGHPVATGPAASWLADHRRDLALVSRYAMELARARRLGSRQESAIERFVRARAEQLLDHIAQPGAGAPAR